MQAISIHVVDLSDLVIKGLLDVAFGLDVPLHLSEALHALDVSCHILVVSVEFVFCEPLDKIAQLQHVEVNERQRATNQEFLLRKEVHDWSHLCPGQLLQLCSILAYIARTSNCTLSVFQLDVYHVNLALLFGCLA